MCLLHLGDQQEQMPAINRLSVVCDSIIQRHNVNTSIHDLGQQRQHFHWLKTACTVDSLNQNAITGLDGACLNGSQKTAKGVIKVLGAVTTDPQVLKALDASLVVWMGYKPLPHHILLAGQAGAVLLLVTTESNVAECYRHGISQGTQEHRNKVPIITLPTLSR
ncbi:hypothetical protein D3C76_1275740 [compost metagenome]